MARENFGVQRSPFSGETDRRVGEGRVGVRGVLEYWFGVRAAAETCRRIDLNAETPLADTFLPWGLTLQARATREIPVRTEPRPTYSIVLVIDLRSWLAETRPKNADTFLLTPTRRHAPRRHVPSPPAIPETRRSEKCSGSERRPESRQTVYDSF